jgi:hypothetical protein
MVVQMVVLLVVPMVVPLVVLLVVLLVVPIVVLTVVQAEAQSAAASPSCLGKPYWSLLAEVLVEPENLREREQTRDDETARLGAD